MPRLPPIAGALLLSSVHLCIDTTSGFAIYHDLVATHLDYDTIVALVILHNVIAFGGQAPVGAFADRFHLYRATGIAGVVLAALGLLLCPTWIVTGLVLVGAGNALFHVGAGALVLRASGDRATEAGVFVGPGAVGLCLGIWLGALGHDLRGLILAGLLGTALLAWWSTRRLIARRPSRVALPSRGALLVIAAAGLLLLSVGLRALVGGTISGAWRGVSWPVLWGLAVAACAGKMAGGWLADRFGWLATSVVALAVSAPLVSVWVGVVPSAIGGMLLFQMTMPVTLKALHLLLPERPGLAFGLPCVALLAGAAPALLGAGTPLSSAALVVLGVAVAVGAVAGGLTILRRLALPPLRSAGRGVLGALLLLALGLAGCREGTPAPPPAPAPSSAAATARVPRIDVLWDPATGRGDVRQYLTGGDILRTCFHCTYRGYTGGLVIGNESGSGYGFYPKKAIRGFRQINVWCAQDESIWDRDERREYTYGWSENYGKGDDGEPLRYVSGAVLEAGPERVALRSENQGGCYRVSKVATTRREAPWWIIATRITNVCGHPLRFDFFSGEDPWIGTYRSSDGDVGWTPAGIVRREVVFPKGTFTAGGMYDLGNSALAQEEGGGFSNQANFYLLDPSTPLPDLALYANSFAHSAADLDPTRPLDNQSLTALNLGWTERVLQPGEGFTVAFAMGLAVTGEPGAVPAVPAITDEDWSVWRAQLPWAKSPDSGSGGGVLFVAEHVTLDLTSARVAVTGVYTLHNTGGASTTLSIRYPVVSDEGFPPPETVEVDGKTLPVRVGRGGQVAVGFPVFVAPHSIRRFVIRYAQSVPARRANYLVTSARRWGRPITRAQFTVRHPASLGEVNVSLPAPHRTTTTRRTGDTVVHEIAVEDFFPEDELVVTW